MKTTNGNEGLLEVIRSDRGLTVRVLGDGASIILHSEPGEEQSLVEQFIAVGQKLSYNGQGVWFFPPGQ